MSKVLRGLAESGSGAVVGATPPSRGAAASATARTPPLMSAVSDAAAVALRAVRLVTPRDAADAQRKAGGDGLPPPRSGATATAAATALAPLVTDSVTLQTLRLSYNRLGSAGSQALSYLLSRSSGSNLRILHVRACQVR